MFYRMLVRVPTFTIVMLKMFFVVCVFAQAGEVAPAQPMTQAKQLQLAELRLKLYELQEYPLQRRVLNSKITIAKAEIDSLKRQLTEYQQFTKFKYSAPMIGQLEHVKVSLVVAEQHLKNLQEEKALLERFHPDRKKLMQLEIDLLKAGLEIKPTQNLLPSLAGPSSP